MSSRGSRTPDDLREMLSWLAFLAGYLAAWADAGGDKARTDLARLADVAYREWLALVADEDDHPLPDTSGIKLRHQPVEEMDDELLRDLNGGDA